MTNTNTATAGPLLLRPYRVNSAHAAARIVALALVADGRLDAVETAALDAHRAHDQLGLSREQWLEVIHDLCDDICNACAASGGCRISGAVIDSLLDDVEDPTTQQTVLRLCSAVVHADRHLDDGECFVLLAAAQRWGLGGDHDPLVEPLLYGRDFQVRPRASVTAGALELG